MSETDYDACLREKEWLREKAAVKNFEEQLAKPIQKHAPLEKEIREECMLLADFLVEKNRAYGNSASEPCRIFAKRVDPLAQIDCRIDDKLSRLMKGTEYAGDNDVKDLTGYLILRMIVEKKQKKDGEA